MKERTIPYRFKQGFSQCIGVPWWSRLLDKRKKLNRPSINIVAVRWVKIENPSMEGERLWWQVDEHWLSAAIIPCFLSLACIENAYHTGLKKRYWVVAAQGLEVFSHLQVSFPCDGFSTSKQYGLYLWEAVLFCAIYSPGLEVKHYEVGLDYESRFPSTEVPCQGKMERQLSRHEHQFWEPHLSQPHWCYEDG